MKPKFFVIIITVTAVLCFTFGYIVGGTNFARKATCLSRTISLYHLMMIHFSFDAGNYNEAKLRTSAAIDAHIYTLHKNQSASYIELLPPWMDYEKKLALPMLQRINTYFIGQTNMFSSESKIFLESIAEKSASSPESVGDFGHPDHHST